MIANLSCGENEKLLGGGITLKMGPIDFPGPKTRDPLPAYKPTNVTFALKKLLLSR